MSGFEIFLLCLGIFIGLPVLSYLVVKFGVAGYYRAKNRNQQKTKQDEKVRET